MELYKEMLINLLACEDVQVTFTNLNINAKEILEAECYRTLRLIKEIINDSSLDDRACFEKIEEIICIFEDIGSECSRHDFG